MDVLKAEVGKVIDRAMVNMDSAVVIAEPFHGLGGHEGGGAAVDGQVRDRAPTGQR